MKRSAWIGLIVALVLVNYLIISQVWNAMGHSVAPAPTPTRTPYPTFTRGEVAMRYITATATPPTAHSPSPPLTGTAEPLSTALSTDAAASATPVAPTPHSTSVAAVIETPAPKVHVVKPGEMLLLIAQEYGLSMEEILQANGLENADFIYIGQELIIPQADAAPTTAPTAMPTPAPIATSFIHVVEAGENLASIASKYGVPVEAIIEANGLRSAEWIFIGQRLIIPATGPTPTPSPSPTGRMHVVQAGENLTWIAEKYGVSVKALMEANGITDADTIYAGQSLIIP